MWLFTKVGFFSVVNNNHPGKIGLLIRARERSHLESLCDLLEINHERILKTPLNDYLYRVEATYSEFDQVMYHFATLPAGYGNFKNECSKMAAEGELDSAYVKTLSEVWHTMHDYQQNNPDNE